MPPETTAAESRSLSVEDAVALLDDQHKIESDIAYAPPDPPKGEVDSDADESVRDEPAGEPSQETAVEAPSSWDEQARARFSELPADIQSLIAARENEHEQALSKARTEADDASKKAEKQSSDQLGEYKTILDR